MCYWVHCLRFQHFAGSPAPNDNWAGGVTAWATVAIALGAIVALFQLREAKKTRHTEAAAGMSSRWETDEYVDARKEIDKYEDSMAIRDALIFYMKERSPERHLLLRELSFFEELGAMEKMGATSLRWINETMRDLVLARWTFWPDFRR